MAKPIHKTCFYKGVDLAKVRDNLTVRNAELTDDEIVRLAEYGFFTAPASVSHHLNVKGGLYQHSVNVADFLAENFGVFGFHWERRRSPYRIGLLHDVCKAFSYSFDKDGKPCRVASPFAGHGMASVALITTTLGIELTEQESLCIAWHMGAWDLDDAERANLDAAMDRCGREIIATHTADWYSSAVTERGMNARIMHDVLAGLFLVGEAKDAAEETPKAEGEAIPPADPAKEADVVSVSSVATGEAEQKPQQPAGDSAPQPAPDGAKTPEKRHLVTDSGDIGCGNSCIFNSFGHCRLSHKWKCAAQDHRDCRFGLVVTRRDISDIGYGEEIWCVVRVVGGGKSANIAKSSDLVPAYVKFEVRRDYLLDNVKRELTKDFHFYGFIPYANTREDAVAICKRMNDALNEGHGFMTVAAAGIDEEDGAVRPTAERPEVRRCFFAKDGKCLLSRTSECGTASDCKCALDLSEIPQTPLKDIRRGSTVYRVSRRFGQGDEVSFYHMPYFFDENSKAEIEAEAQIFGFAPYSMTEEGAELLAKILNDAMTSVDGFKEFANSY